MKILHLLQNSLPLISGSTIRSKYIFKYQKKFAKIIALTSFFFKKSGKNPEIIDGIPYYRIDKRISFFLRNYYIFLNRINSICYKFFNIDLENKFQYYIISLFSKYYIKKLVKFYKIDIIHQHTHHQIGKYALEVARKYDIPFIYEVRGFVEENLKSNLKYRKNIDSKIVKYNYSKIKVKETELMKKSDLIITLSDPMKEELIKRNINKSKIKIIPNCTDTDLLKPIESNLKLKKDLDLNGKLIIGFIGRLIWYEGIEILIKAIPILIEEIQNLKILLIGNADKYYLNYLIQLSEKLRVSKFILFLGSIPHNVIKEYYSIIDIIILPRLNYKVCNVVTPLKPLEAMAFKTLVIASDFPALRCTIIPKKTGDLFRAEDPKELASKIIYYLKNLNEKKRIEDFAKKFVEKNFTWKNIVPNYKEIYQDLLDKKNQ